MMAIIAIVIGLLFALEAFLLYTDLNELSRDAAINLGLSIVCFYLAFKFI